MATMPPVLATAAAMGPLNPLEGLIMGINTNPYFIGLMMLRRVTLLWRLS